MLIKEKPSTPMEQTWKQNECSFCSQGNFSLMCRNIKYFAFFHKNCHFVMWKFCRGLAWCPVFKAGSSSWLANIPYLVASESKNKVKIKKLLDKLRSFYTGIQIARLFAPHMSLPALSKFLVSENPVKFVIVRHPFDRLISGLFANAILFC